MEDEIYEYLTNEVNNNHHGRINTVAMMYPSLKNKSGGKPALLKCLDRLIKAKKVKRAITVNGTITFEAMTCQTKKH